MTKTAEKRYDVFIIGGGPAGLSAALVLGRCRRKVVVFDDGKPRNAAAQEMHGFLSRDCLPPAEFAAISREQLKRYPEVELVSGEAVKCERLDEHFAIRLRDGRSYTARCLLLATGVVDEIPRIPRIQEFYGRTVHHCPYCDGWEHRGKRMAVYGRKKAAAELALELLGWTSQIALCTDGDPEFEAEMTRKLEVNGIMLIREPVERLEGTNGVLERIRFKDGLAHTCDALFFPPEQHQRSHFARDLGCELCEDGMVQPEEGMSTAVPGVYVAGNASTGLQMVIMAAASGAHAAFTINQRLIEADLVQPAGK